MLSMGRGLFIDWKKKKRASLHPVYMDWRVAGKFYKIHINSEYTRDSRYALALLFSNFHQKFRSIRIPSVRVIHKHFHFVEKRVRCINRLTQKRGYEKKNEKEN